MAPSNTDKWEAVGRKLLANELANRRHAVEQAFHGAEEALYAITDERGWPTGTLDAEHISELRYTLGMAQLLVEDYSAAVTDGVEPWDYDPLPPQWVLEDWATPLSQEDDDE